jgi:hypothetical protein
MQPDEPAANDPGPMPDLDVPPDHMAPEHWPDMHERRTKRGPFSPFDWTDNRTPPDYPTRTVTRAKDIDHG